MSVEPLQVHNPEAVPQTGRRVPEAGAPDGAQAPSRGPLTPQDEVVVSDQARRLALGGPEPEAPRLQLDFKQLRELAFDGHSEQAAGSTE